MPFIYMPWMGADHADDLQYVFAKPLRNKRGIYKENEVQMSIALMTYWTNFAWTGFVEIVADFLLVNILLNNIIDAQGSIS